jgi:LysR substrate binding domain
MVAVRVSADQRLVVVGSPDYFARRGKPAHPRDLHDHDCINLRKITSGTVDRWRFIEAGKDFEIAVDGHVVTNDGAVLVEAAVEGVGLAYVFESMVRELVSQKRLVRVLDSYCPEIPGYFLRVDTVSFMRHIGGPISRCGPCTMRHGVLEICVDRGNDGWSPRARSGNRAVDADRGVWAANRRA